MSDRIGKIVIQDFRAFPGNCSYIFDLKTDGKNLLIYGENGSGKSSLYHALRLLLTDSPPAEPFTRHSNIFASGVDGTVTVALTGAPPRDFRWEHGGDHPATNTADRTFLEAARRSAFLDYKAMLRTSLLHEDSDCVNLFDLLVDTILRDYKLPDGKTLSRHWCEVRFFRPRPASLGEESEGMDSPETEINARAREFRALLGGVLNSGRVGIESRANRLLRQLDPRLRIVLRVDPIRLEAKSTDPSLPHTFRRCSIRLEASYCKRQVAHPPAFLNEARLTAIALALYLAGVQMAVPDSVGSVTSRLLVMDDVLIGLDIAHRIPILKLLRREFRDWQVILMTHDRIWFDLAREFTRHGHKWVYYTMRELAAPLDSPTTPLVLEEGLDEVDRLLDQADCHLSSTPPDYMAAAVYIGAGFETTIKRVCKNCHVRVEYQPNPTRLKTDALWRAIVRHHEDRLATGKSDFLPTSLISEVDAFRSRVLNAFSHSGTLHLVGADIHSAWATVQRLHRHSFPKG